MEAVSEHRLPRADYAWSASTTGGNPISCAAALAMLDLLAESRVYEHLHEMGRRFRNGMKAILADQSVAGQVLGDGPLGQVAFSSVPVVNQQTWLASDRARGRRLMLSLLRRGVFLNPMGTKMYLSLAHDTSELVGFFDRFAEALSDSDSERGVLS